MLWLMEIQTLSYINAFQFPLTHISLSVKTWKDSGVGLLIAAHFINFCRVICLMKVLGFWFEEGAPESRAVNMVRFSCFLSREADSVGMSSSFTYEISGTSASDTSTSISCFTRISAHWLLAENVSFLVKVLPIFFNGKMILTCLTYSCADITASCGWSMARTTASFYQVHQPISGEFTRFVIPFDHSIQSNSFHARNLSVLVWTDSSPAQVLCWSCSYLSS